MDFFSGGFSSSYLTPALLDCPAFVRDAEPTMSMKFALGKGSGVQGKGNCPKTQFSLGKFDVMNL